jgi:nucleoside phosphorylase
MEARAVIRRSWVRTVLVAALAVSVSACGGDSEASSTTPPQRFAVLSAFPAELAPLLERATVNDTAMVNGHVFRIGTLGGAAVVLGLTGVGLVNAATTTAAVLEQFQVTGIVVSAVAGSSLSIGDVVVPTAWRQPQGTAYPARREWLDAATALAAAGSVTFEQCTLLPTRPTAPEVCLPHQPAIVVGGVGESSDPYGGMAAGCLEGGGDVLGCDVEPPPSSRTSPRAFAVAAAEADTPIATDMETAAIAAEAAARGVPFIAFRAVSDGADDPLGLPGFPAQFFAYYRLAAYNAAAATTAFLERVGGSTK